MVTKANIPPEGVFPFFMADTAAQKYEMKTGNAIIDLVHRKTFNTAKIVQEIKTYGFMCAFEPCESHLTKCGLDEFVVVCDSTSKYGEMFLLLYSKVAITSFRSLAEKEEEIANIKKREDEIREAEEKEAKLIRKSIVYVDTPIISKTYKSLTNEVTEQEVAFLTIASNRPLFSTVVSRPEIDEEINFEEQILSTSSSIVKKEEEKENKYIKCTLRDIWTQTPTSTIDSAVQTTWHRKVNKIIQYEPLSLDDFQIDDGSILLDGVCNTLRTVLPHIERVLQENETVNIYSDYFHSLAKDEISNDLALGEKDSINEIGNFTDLDYSKGKILSSIDAHPTDKDILAVSICEPGSVDDKFLTSGSAKTGFLILWKFRQQMHPHRILKAPFDCPIFKFNPTSPNIIVAGGVGGQVVMWNIQHQYNGSSGEQEGIEDEKVPLNPIAMSFPDHSHRRGMVADLCWLPSHTQINARGHLLADRYLTDNISNQFFTISGDGQIIFWDIRFEDIIMGKLPHIAKVKGTKQSHHHVEDNSSEFVTNRWAPLFKIKPKRLSGTGELSLCKTLIPKKRDDKIGCSESHIICTSEEGEVLQVDWSPALESNGSGKEQEADFASPEYVQWMKKDHNRPCVGLSQNPVFQSYVLSVSDWNFHIWRTDSESMHPVFTSPYTSCHITCGQWSPTRSAVLFISKSNGSVDVWDFTDSCYSPSSSFSLIPNPITTMHFLESSGKDEQYLAIGDSIGSLHVFDVPKNLVKLYPKENDAMSAFLHRASTFSKESELEGDNRSKSNGKSLETPGELLPDTNFIPNPDQCKKGLSQDEDSFYLDLEREFLDS